MAIIWLYHVNKCHIARAAIVSFYGFVRLLVPVFPALTSANTLFSDSSAKVVSQEIWSIVGQFWRTNLVPIFQFGCKLVWQSYNSAKGLKAASDLTRHERYELQMKKQRHNCRVSPRLILSAAWWKLDIGFQRVRHFVLVLSLVKTWDVCLILNSQSLSSSPKYSNYMPLRLSC